MRTLSVSCAVLAVAIIAGCDRAGTTGGPGATNPTTKSQVVGQPEDTFTLSTPLLATSLKQGEAKVVTIGISRSTRFDQDVSIQFENLPTGVTVDPSSGSIKSKDLELKVTVKAADDASLGDFTIKVVGHPNMGADATKEMKVSVTKK